MSFVQFKGPVPVETAADTVEGRLADMMEWDQVRIGIYNVSRSDVRKIVLALRRSAMQEGS